ncbi:MAG: potassium channel protein [Deltaproteobacteria bacterium]|nr:potassium channel protein [Deltaproteobacteria bacterium]
MKKILLGLAAFILIIAFGVLGYMALEHLSFLDALYMTVITITTVGYREVAPLDPAGKIFTIVLIIVGVGFVLYVFGKFTETIVEGGLRKALGRINMDKKLANITAHYIVCGYGRIGKIICDSFRGAGRSFVVIDNNPERLAQIVHDGILFVEGEAADDENLVKAGVERAQGLVSVVSSDADNVYITLSARELNPKLLILSRASGHKGADTKLRRAGADKVISPYDIGARQMANMILRPNVDAFLDLTVGANKLGLLLEEIVIPASAPFVNCSLADSGLRRDYDVIVVAIKRKADGGMIFNPSYIVTIGPEDTIIVLGDRNNIERLEKDL